MTVSCVSAGFRLAAVDVRKHAYFSVWLEHFQLNTYFFVNLSVCGFCFAYKHAEVSVAAFSVAVISIALS